MKTFRYFLLVMFFLTTSYSECYFVAKNGSNSNNGTKLSPRLTINSGCALLSGGDTLYIRAGTYNERMYNVIPSGSSSNPTIIAGYPGDARPVLRKIFIRNRSHIKIIGLELTHEIDSDTNGIELYARGTDVVRYISVQNCYIHDIYGTGIKGIMGKNQSNWTFRGNSLYYMGHQPSQAGKQNGGIAFNISDTNGGYYLAEYNRVARAGDFCNILSTNVIVRNNFMKDFRNSYWPDGNGDGLHADFFQPGGVSSNPANNQIYESNVFGENWELNSHLYHFQSTFSGDYGRIIRGNVVYNLGAGVGGCYGIDSVTHYNNTYYNVNMLTRYSGGVISFNTISSNASVGNKVFNNSYSIYAKGYFTGNPYMLYGNGTSCSGSNNTGFLYSGASCVANGWQNYTDTTNKIFTIPSTSLNVNNGRALSYITSESGSGTNFTIADRWVLCDGYGMTRGDSIFIGYYGSALVTDVSGLDVTVAEPVYWSYGDSIFWRSPDRITDVGAYEYRSETGYDIDISTPGNQTIFTDGSTVNINTTVTNRANIRMVEFFVNGLSTGIDYDYPFSSSWVNKSSFDTIQISAVAYPLWADTTLFRSDTITVYNE